MSTGLDGIRPHPGFYARVWPRTVLPVNTMRVGGVSLMVKNCTLRTRWVRDDLWTDSQGTQFLASQTGTP